MFVCVWHFVLVLHRLTFHRGGTLFSSIKVWLSVELQIASIDSMQLTYLPALDRDLDCCTIDEVGYSVRNSVPFVSIHLWNEVDCRCSKLPDHFVPETYFSSTFDDFQNEQSNGAQVCALGFLRYHRHAMMMNEGNRESCVYNFPHDTDSFNRLIHVVKRLRIAWGNSDVAKWIDPQTGPFEMSKLFCKSLGSRIGTIQSFGMLDSGSIVRILYKCCLFFLWEHGLPHDTLHASLWAYRRWYQAIESGVCSLSEEDYTRINLIFNDFRIKVQFSYAKLPNIHLGDEHTEDSLGLGFIFPSSQSSHQSSLGTEKESEIANLGDVSEIPDDVQEIIECSKPFHFDFNDQLTTPAVESSELQFKIWLQTTQAEQWVHALRLKKFLCFYLIALNAPLYCRLS
jgi:hypothetical protein